MASHDFSIVRMLEDLPGRKVLYISHAKPDPMDECIEIPDLGRVQGIVWVAPWAESMLKLGTHREVDASFKVMSPYVYYIPTAVIQNTGLACGFSIAPSERSTIYSRWENCLRERVYTPVLSDMGEAIAKFCSDFDLYQFYCHKNILEAVGLHTPAAHLFTPKDRYGA